MGLLSFTISVVAAIMSFFKVTRLPAFAVAIVGIIYAMVTWYQKSKNENQEKTDSKASQALEVGAVIISGIVCVTYLVLLWF